MATTEDVMESLAALVSLLERRELGGLVERVSRVLADFYRAPLSMSSVQPILALAEELNPELRMTGVNGVARPWFPCEKKEMR